MGWLKVGMEGAGMHKGYWDAGVDVEWDAGVQRGMQRGCSGDAEKG